MQCQWLSGFILFVCFKVNKSTVSFYEGFPLRWKDQGFQAGACVIFPNGAGGGGQTRSPWRLDDRDPALPDFPLWWHPLSCVLCLLMHFFNIFCLLSVACFWHTASWRPGLKRRGKISLVYSQEEKKLVKQIIWIFIAPHFYGSHFACNFSTHYSILHGTHFLSFCFSRRQGHTLSGTAKGTRWSVGDYWWSANRPHIFVAFLLQSKTKIYSKNKI